MRFTHISNHHHVSFCPPVYWLSGTLLLRMQSNNQMMVYLTEPVVSQVEERLSKDSVRRHESDFSLCTPNYLSSSISKNKFIFHKASFASATPPPLPNCLRAIRCHFDHGYLAKGEKERERERERKKYISQLSVLAVFAEPLTSTSSYLSNLI